MGKKDTGLMPKEVAIGKAIALCSSSEHCTSQIMEKLSLWNVSVRDTNNIMDYLVKEKYIDNKRFARAYCHDKFCYNHWGRIKIRQMLRHLRFDDEEIEEGMQTIPDEDYLQTLNDALQAKDRTLREKDVYQRKAKLVRHLLSRGFETELVLDAVNDFLNLD
ncbi:MAG: RecX family transcriptional regulator [Bacteroidaceae bacterium]|nr:RecX family transcriptional regulator [Bacteroidaceae bacterium]